MANLEAKSQNAGFVVGTSLGRRLDARIKRRINEFDIAVTGAENLQQVDGKPYILVANHVQVRSPNPLFASIGIGPDAFVIRDAVENVHVVARYNPNIRIERMLGRRGLPIVEGFLKGVLLGNGFLPIRTEGGGLNEEFLGRVEEVIDRKEPILIFPTEPSDNFNPEVERIRRGAAVVAIKYDLPIVPLYVGGAHTWRAGEQISLSYGEPIEPYAKGVDEMTALVGQKIFELKNEKVSP